MLQVSRGAILAAGAVLTPNKTVPSGQIWAGNPAKYLRDLDEEEADFIIQSAENYAALAAVHSAENSKTFEEVEVCPLLHIAVLCQPVPALVSSSLRASLLRDATFLLLARRLSCTVNKHSYQVNFPGVHLFKLGGRKLPIL